MTSIRGMSGALRFVAAAVAIASLALAVVGFALWEMRKDATGLAVVHASDMATLLAEDVANATSALDVTLRDIVDLSLAASQGGAITRENGEILRSALVSRRVDAVRAGVIAVANDAGDVVAAAHDQGRIAANVSDREYFARQRDGRKAGLFISRPMVSKLDGEWTIFLSRRIEAPDGRFLGVAFVGLAPAKLFQFHPERIEKGATSFSFIHADGTVAMREPDKVEWAGKRVPAESEWWTVAAQGGGEYHSPGVLDVYAKYVAVRPVAGTPYFVSVGISDQAALASWRARALTIVLGGAIAIALIIGLLYSQMRLADRLSRSRIRSWMRGRRLAANATELLCTRKRFGLTLDYISQGMAMFDADEKLVFSNRSYAELYGLREEQIRPGMDVREIFALRIAGGAYARGNPRDYLKILDEDYAPVRLDYLNNGRVILVREKETDDGGWVTVQEDVTERTRAAQELAHSALHDSLTQLPNRQAFKDHLAACFAIRKRERFAILLVDIDGFKEVNDTYGHEIGDEVLVEVARRLCRDGADRFIARLGGDEFVVVLAGEDLDADAATRVADRLIDSVHEPFSVGGRVIAIGLCVGVNMVETDESDFSTIMRRADLALYAAKNGGRNCVRRFDEDMERQYSRRVELARDLRDAIDGGKLAVHYQPIVEAAGRAIVCMEALARWNHPVQGPISPATFIPLAEETGLVVSLGNWVLRRACADAAAWRSDAVVAVNVSSLQIERADFVETVVAILDETKLPPRRLQIEITESSLLRNTEATSRALQSLRALGVSFALDDFGTGFASLAYLKAFPLDKVKIDKSFVDDICLDKQSIAIVAAIVALARGLDVQTTAEGVETQDQYDILRAIGVNTMQGYLFGRPKAIDDYEPGALARADARPPASGARAA